MISRLNKYLQKFENYTFTVFIVASVSLSFVLVVISMYLYNSSGAAQLDLSRPGYVDIRSQATNTSSYKDFPSSGPLDLKVVTDFEELFLKQSLKITSANVFSGDPLSPEALGLGAVF